MNLEMQKMKEKDFLNIKFTEKWNYETVGIMVTEWNTYVILTARAHESVQTYAHNKN